MISFFLGSTAGLFSMEHNPSLPQHWISILQILLVSYLFFRQWETIRTISAVAPFLTGLQFITNAFMLLLLAIMINETRRGRSGEFRVFC